MTTDIASLPASRIEQGWRDTFVTTNPFCPCDLKTFTKAVRWAEAALASPAGEDGWNERDTTLTANFYGARRYTGDPLTFDGWSFTQEGLREFVRAVDARKIPDRTKDYFND